MLISILKDKFDLNVTKTKNKDNKWRLYVGTENYEKIKKLIYPHLIQYVILISYLDPIYLYTNCIC